MIKKAKPKTTRAKGVRRPRANRTRAAAASDPAALATFTAAKPVLTPRSALPRLVVPVIRDVRRDRIDPRMLAASGTCKPCLEACDRLPVALQSTCRHLCQSVCKL